VVTAEPTYLPTDSDASPRVRSAFTTVRRRMLPAIIQQQYGQAKAAFDRYPRLTIVLGHLGEGLPSSIWRIDHRLGAPLE